MRALCLLALAASAAACLASPADSVESPPAGDGAAADGAPADGPDSLAAREEPYAGIPDPGTVYGMIALSEPCTVAKVAVDVSIVHGWRGDIELTMEGPTHRIARLKQFDDDPHKDIVGNYPLTLTPVDSLELYVGESATGTWVLTVIDVESGDTGIFEYWMLDVTCQ